jgi:hypothetical protein
MGYAALSQETGIPERTLRDHMRWLVDNDWLSQRRKSPMDATTVWTVNVARVDAAESAGSIRQPDPAGSADSIRQPADTADSTRQDSPTLDAAGSADSTYIREEEDGGDVAYSGSEQHQQKSDEGVTDGVSPPGAVTRHVTTEPLSLPDFPWWAKQHYLLSGLDEVAQSRWMQAWRTVAAQQGTSWTANDHLTLYLARCGELKKKPNPEEWIRWFAQDEQKAQQELRLRREEKDQSQRPTNPDWQ